MSSNQGFHFKQFSDLDNSPDAGFLINSMVIMSELPCIREIKKLAIESMCLKPGSIILEAGCGHGIDAENIGKIIGNKGKVIALDLSERMVKEAVSRSTQPNVLYKVGDIRKLGYENNSFDACHADRLLVSHSDYKEIFAEMVRVVKPGGIISITDVDALSITMYPYNSSTKTVLQQIHENFVNPFMGRALKELYVENGLLQLQSKAFASTVNDFETLSKIFDFPTILQNLVNTNKFMIEEANLWIQQMEESSRRQSFIYSVTLFLITGIVP